MKRFSQAKSSFILMSLLMGLIWFISGCGGQQPAPVVLVTTPSIGEPKVGAPSPQQPGEEIGISIEIASTGGATLNYTWTADGGEIVRGQGSPAITYRVPKDPGTYNIRVKVEWDGQSVEKVTSVKVEGPASASTSEPPTDTLEPLADTPTSKPTNTPEPTNTPQPPTATPTPKATNTPKPTNTPRPIPTPTATIDTDPTVYDNFNNPANDGNFNQSQWEHWSDPPYQIAQQTGVLVVSHNGKADNGSALASRKFINFTPDEPIFFETKLMLDPNAQSKSGNVQMHLNADFSVGKSWFSECGVYDDNGNGGAYCFDTVWPWQDGHSYDATGQSVSYGSWHTFRIELEPATMTFTYYIDGQKAGSHIPVDAEQLKKAGLTFSVGVWSPSTETYTGYIDDVRIGPGQ